MLTFIEENVVLILSATLTFLSAIILVCSAQKGGLSNLIGDRISFCKEEIGCFFKRLLLKKGFFKRILSTSLVIMFACTYLVVLKNIGFSIWAVILLFLPLALFSAILVEIFLVIVSFLLGRLLHLERKEFNIIYSYVLMQFILLGVYSCFSSENFVNDGVFVLAVINLLFCYLLAAVGLYLLLKEASEIDTNLTLKSVWKSAFLQIVLFLIILTFLGWFGYLHNPSSYQTPDGNFSFFAAFYHIAVTFGTVGYGDIIPLTNYTRFVSVLTVFTSVVSITVMLSAVLSLSGRILNRKNEALSGEKVLDKDFKTSSNKQNPADNLSLLSKKVSKSFSDKDGDKT